MYRMKLKAKRRFTSVGGQRKDFQKGKTYTIDISNVIGTNIKKVHSGGWDTDKLPYKLISIRKI